MSQRTEARSEPLFASNLAGIDAGPKKTTTLLSRRVPLASPEEQMRVLESVDLGRFGFSHGVGIRYIAGQRLARE